MTERHVVPDHGGGGWKVIGSSTGATESRTTTQAGAIADAEYEVRRAGGGEVLIHGLDGKVNDKRKVEPGT
ncbi:DUF2188 domain-containing protein [Saccharopolyspora phatthalungensis]|uniref:DUF2188 domain-containing protein n=1 Tax=Saccharopolyspora phatthalungensis TaxID=664693 RepID=A0A840QJL3_9PSEU|nr:DUF2188 domain-containing protein [Saccharopolyspora phatthalungensis]MBB5159269.1 hypothetical protein [Saccharopolyspora phatthalungensis]